MIKAKTSNRPESREMPIAGIEVTKLVREFVPVVQREHGGTIGQVIDDMLVEMVRKGQEMHSVTVHMEGPQWNAFAENIRSTDHSNEDVYGD